MSCFFSYFPNSSSVFLPGAEPVDLREKMPLLTVVQVVVMLSAEYGRMRIGRCVQDGLGFLGCSSNVLSLADRKCSGRQSCRISIPDKDFDSTRPCNKEVKVYLEASYVCKSGRGHATICLS